MTGANGAEAGDTSALPNLADVFASGYEHCQSRYLTGLTGLSLTQHTNRIVERRAQVRQNPGNVFGVTITLRSQVSEVRHGRRIVRSGRLPEGCVTYAQPGDLVRAETPGRWDTLFALVPCRLVERVCEAAELPIGGRDLAFINAPTATDHEMLDIARRAQMEMRRPGPFARLRADLLAQELVVHVLSVHSTASHALKRAGSVRARGGLAPRQLRRAMEAMDAFAETEITLAMLAQAAGCSPTHFSRAFKQSTGIAPFAWLLDRRVERAKALLRDPNNSLADTALAVGFAAQPQFTAAFKRVTGQPPGAWRRHRLG